MKWFLVILSGFFLLSHSNAWGAEWKYCGQTPKASYFYDAESMIRRENIVKVWLKAVYSEEGRSDEAEKLGGKCGNLTDSVALVKIDCKNRWQHVAMLMVYSMEGKVMISGFEERQRDFMIPGSILKSLYRMVCK